MTGHEVPRQSYYRHDYDRQREEAPSRHAYSSKPPPVEEPSMAYHHSYGPPRPSPHNMAYPPQHERHPSSWTEPQPSPSYHQMQLSPQTRYSPGPAGREPYVTDQGSNPPSKPRNTVRMLTLLIEDVRTEESQLAEIKVPLKPAAVPEDGFWANAKEVTDILQISPSRIDGMFWLCYSIVYSIHFLSQGPRGYPLCEGNINRFSYACQRTVTSSARLLT